MNTFCIHCIYKLVTVTIENSIEKVQCIFSYHNDKLFRNWRVDLSMYNIC